MRTPLACTILAFAVAVPGMVAADLTDPLTPQRYIVGFHTMPDVNVGDSYQGEKVVAVDDDLRYIVIETLNFALFEARARIDENVRYIEYDDPLWGFVDYTPNDYFWNHASNWGVKKINAMAAWDLTLGTTAVKVAVTDSGVLKTHEDLTGGRMLQGYDYYNNDNDPNDKCGHGTHVTGTIAATINNAKGFAGLAQVNVAMFKGLEKVFGGCYGGTTALVNAMKAAGDGGYPLSSNSWGSTGPSTAFNDAVAYSFARGTTFVAAAGNSGPCTNCIDYPWRDVGNMVIIVGATTSSDTQASFSSEGAQIDVAAPGDGIGSSYIKTGSCGATNCYVILSGTSMATPHVTGTLALVKTLNPGFGYTDFNTRITSTAVDLGPAGFDNDFGYGRINAAAAVY